ncbi:MAG: hypothetical protein IPG17_16300, partial [Sandaracinaceae bacterium]|nr:hypothetical protein [Sandaracinaceae bacterium]
AATWTRSRGTRCSCPGTNRGEDFTRYVDTLAGQLDERVNAERLDRAALPLADARTQLIGAINDGSFWFHYQGHGASSQLDDGLLTMADVAGLTNSNALTIFTGMSCSTSRFGSGHGQHLGADAQRVAGRRHRAVRTLGPGLQLRVGQPRGGVPAPPAHR